jgi:hypothetical protein
MHRIEGMRSITTLILILTFPSVVLAQDARMERIRQVYPVGAVVEIEGILAEAEAQGVPTDPLIAKALEGAAKGVPADRVVAALSAYRERLGESRSLIGSGRGAAEVVAGADALRRGVPGQTMRSLAGEHEGDLAVPLVVLGDLMDAGVPVDNAYMVVQNALQHRHGPEEMLAIPGAVRRMTREGQTPSQAANAVGNAIGRGKFNEVVGPHGRAMATPPQGPPVPPGSSPPDHAGPKRGKKQSKGKPPPGGEL